MKNAQDLAILGWAVALVVIVIVFTSGVWIR
jgi:hypothetical protein